ncbi:MAG: Sip1-related alpha-galactosidase [Candidatus Glassbacteria bacterium]
MRAQIIMTLILLAAAACGDRNGSAVPENGGWTLAEGILKLGSIPVLEGLPAGVTVAEPVDTSGGAFLALTTDQSGRGIQHWTGIRITGRKNLLALWRMKPWWTRPAWPAEESAVPAETETLLWLRADGRYGILLPILDQGFRLTLKGDSAGLTITADNNLAEGPLGCSLAGVYLALGDDPYELIDRAFSAVVRRMGVGNLREEKPEPAWIDRLGWASWYAFFQGVSEDKFLSGIGSLEDDGVNLGWVLLDDGWQDRTPDGNLLRSFGPDPKKFPHGLEWLVEKVTRDYGTPYFLIWHTLEGYWRGIDSLSAAMSRYPQYASDGRSNRPFPPRYEKDLRGRWNVPRPEAITAFFYDYHAYLSTRGIDGVKVDNQSDLAYMTYGLGPMTEVMGQYIRALEESATAHFGPGNVIDCMSMVHDALYQYRRSSITRTSTDFFPDSASSWGPHLVQNAFSSLFWGEIIRPDWDMWKSVHPAAAYHAAGRVISGGPVYLSDEPAKHNISLIRRVALPDGRVLRPRGVPRPTAGILFRDPETEPVLLTVFNANGNGTYLLGAFHANYTSDGPITGWIGPGMIHGLDPGTEYAVRSNVMDQPRIMTAGDSLEISLEKFGFYIYTVSPVDRGVAPLGLAGMFNPAGVFEKFGWLGPDTFAADVITGGDIDFYSERAPKAVESSVGGCSFIFGGEGMANVLTVSCGGAEPRRLTLKF